MLSLSAIIVGAWRFYVKHFEDLLVYMAFLFLPTFVLSILGLLGIELNKVLPGSVLVSNIIIAIIFLVTLLFTFWTTVALTFALKALMDGETNTSWRAMFDKAYPMLWPFALTSLLVGFAVIGGTLLFIIPGIIFTIWFCFSTYVVLFDGQKGVAALKASKSLVVGRWWSILIRIVVPNLVFLVVFMLVETIISYPLARFLPLGPTLVAVNVIEALAQVIVTPLTGAALLIVYLDAKRTPINTQNPLSPSSK
jgi:hypothetical protein